MAIEISDYLIDHAGIDWSKALSTWSWLLPEELTLWLVNRFGDLFIVLSDGTVHMLDIGSGTFTKIAESRDDFCTKIDGEEKAAEWLMIPLVKRLAGAGMVLKPGECYGLARPPVLGGEYTIENIRPIACSDYLSGYGKVHEQIRDLPDGTRVVLKPT